MKINEHVTRTNYLWVQLVYEFNEHGKINKRDILYLLGEEKGYVPDFAKPLLALAITGNIFRKGVGKLGRLDAIRMGVELESLKRQFEEESIKSLNSDGTPLERAKEQVAKKYKVTTRTIETLTSKYINEIWEAINYEFAVDGTDYEALKNRDWIPESEREWVSIDYVVPSPDEALRIYKKMEQERIDILEEFRLKQKNEK